MSSDPLAVFQDAIAGGHAVEMVAADGSVVEAIGEATSLKVGLPNAPVALDLGDETRFESQSPEKKFIDVKTVWFCYLKKDLSITEYITAADEQGVPHLRFLERTDLLNYLQEKTPSDFIKRKKGAAVSFDVKVEKRAIPEELKVIYNEEITLVDHNMALRGNKHLDFSNVSDLCHKEIIYPFKSKGKRAKAEQPAAPTPSPFKGKNKDPIILLSPSPSSMLNMANVKEFLENGTFEPILRQAGSPNLLHLSRTTKHHGQVRFAVVDSPDKFKAEYWDRVVAVFVTGQAWQFANYKWKDPYTLFHKVMGYALVYKGDQVPAQIKNWNVKVEVLDRTHRFRDREVVERIWEGIEANMSSRGWAPK